MNNEMVSTNWITNILYQQEIAKIALEGKKLNGFVHDLIVADQFSMTLLLEKQLVALHKLPYKRRIIHLDATGKLVNIPKYMRDYNRILTYGLIVQDLDKFSNDFNEGICMLFLR
jgi:hypothetical protein